MVIRKSCLDQLILWKNHDVIKVVSGIRRCGKSTLLKQFQNHLRDDGVTDEQIISINFDDSDSLLDHKALYEYVENKLLPNQKMYIFLDEVQKVFGFEKAVDRLCIKENVDVYIAGSSAHILLSDLSSRYVVIRMFPLTFKEVYEEVGGNKEEVFDRYLKYGGFSDLINIPLNDEERDMYMEGVYNTIIAKDIEERENGEHLDKNKRKITNVVLLKAIAKYLVRSAGNMVSVNDVTRFLISTGRKVSSTTVHDYMEALREAFIFYPVDRFDISRKKVLKKLNKWYIVDLALIKNRYDLDFSLENTVYFELLKRGYSVNIGKAGSSTIDFVAQKNRNIEYFQVSSNMTNQKTFETLRCVKDDHKKIVLTLDKSIQGNHEGIEVVNVIDWLLEG